MKEGETFVVNPTSACNAANYVNSLFGIWAAVPTPFRNDGSVDFEGIAGNARTYADTLRIAGIFCNGLIGEGWALDVCERKAIVDCLTAEGGDRLAVGVVVTHHCLRETLLLARHAEASGARHIVLMRPRGPFTDQQVRDYVAAIRDAVDLPLVLFEGHSPSTSFGADLVAELSTDNAISGVKVTGGFEHAATLRNRCAARLQIYDPLEANWLTNLSRFDMRVLYADPEPYLFQVGGYQPIGDYFKAWLSGNIDLAWQISKRLEPLRQVYGRWVMEPLKDGIAPNAAVKAWCEFLGLRGGQVRPPLTPLDASQKAKLCHDLIDAGLQPA